MRTIDLNCDMGESFGAWKMGDDRAIMPLITSANVACGFHAGDPSTIRATVRLAVDHGVAVGAHPSYPDLQGFGRRAMQIGAQPQYTLMEVGENLDRMDQQLFESLVTRDALGFLLVGPPDGLEHQAYFTEPMFREFANFLVEKYDSIVCDLGRNITSELALGALQVASQVFLVMDQDYPSIRNAQRYLSYLLRFGFSQDQVKILVNRYSKKADPQHASLEQIQSTLNMKVFYGIPPSPAVLASINKSRPFVANREAAGDLDRVFRQFVDKATGRNKEEVAKAG